MKKNLILGAIVFLIVAVLAMFELSSGDYDQSINLLFKKSPEARRVD